jgi:hypothetical protein
MKVIIHECKGNDVNHWRTVECDSWSIEGRHISIVKDGRQIIHLPARFFSIETI